MPATARSLLTTLREVRAARRVSQLELSFRLGVSQRHVSFVESGRAKPSRTLLIAWLQALSAPLAVCNDVMLQAGYAPVYGDASMDDPALAHASEALSHLLHAHDPMPAFVIDSAWNVRRANTGAQWLMLKLLPWLAHADPAASLNMLDLLAHADGLLSRMLNLREIGPALLAHVRDDAAAHPALLPKVDAIAAALRERIGPDGDRDRVPRPLAPTLVTRFATDIGTLSFFSMLTTFGTPQHITLASLRVEHLFAADETTRAIMQAQVG
jgi:transcriptional regulator with XRE-family HTH domain